MLEIELLHRRACEALAEARLRVTQATDPFSLNWANISLRQAESIHAQTEKAMAERCP